MKEITRKDALEISRKILLDAEKERNKQFEIELTRIHLIDEEIEKINFFNKNCPEWFPNKLVR